MAKNRWWRHDNGYHRGWDKRKGMSVAIVKAGAIVTIIVEKARTWTPPLNASGNGAQCLMRRSASYQAYKPAL